MEAPLDLELFRRARQFREGWQCRVLKKSRDSRAVVLSILAHNFEDAILTICQAIWPDFAGLDRGLISAGKIDKAGRVVADYAEKDGSITANKVIYNNDIEYRDDMRRIADRLKLSDQDRLEFFTCVKRWLVADLRLDPTMDPMDPDAKHLTRH